MSAFVVNHGHIRALLAAGLRQGRGVEYRLQWYQPGEKIDGLYRAARQLDFTSTDAVGAMLVAENVASVRHRYPGHDDDDLPSAGGFANPFVYRSPARVPSPVEALKLLDCYEYQSCEHPGWESSEARVFCGALRSWATSQLPGYSEAPWEWREASRAADPIEPVLP